AAGLDRVRQAALAVAAGGFGLPALRDIEVGPHHEDHARSLLERDEGRLDVLIAHGPERQRVAFAGRPRAFEDLLVAIAILGRDVRKRRGSNQLGDVATGNDVIHVEDAVFAILHRDDAGHALQHLMAAEHGIQHLLYGRRHAIGARVLVNIPAPTIVPHAIPAPGSGITLHLEVYFRAPGNLGEGVYLR